MERSPDQQAPGEIPVVDEVAAKLLNDLLKRYHAGELTYVEAIGSYAAQMAERFDT